VRVLTLLGIVLILATPMVPLAQYTHAGQGMLYVNEPMLSIGNNTTIGQLGYKTDYYMNTNLTIQAGKKLTLLNLDIYIQASQVNITDLGSLNISNSCIQMYSVNQSLGLYVKGTSSTDANLSIKDSSWSDPGSIVMSYATARIVNSTISSGFEKPSTMGQTLQMTITNSSLISYNSTFDGLLHTPPIMDNNVAYVSYARDVPFSTEGNVPLTDFLLSGSDPLVTGIMVNLTYSGNNPTGNNALNFSYAGNFESFKFGDTGSVHVESSTSFNLTLSGKLSDLNNLVSNLYASMYIANTQGSNSSIESLNITLLSNDTVSLYGLNYFSYEISNSSITLAGSSLDLDRNNPYIYKNVMNPGHDFLLAENSSIYILGTEITGEKGNSSFFSNIDSSVLLYSYVYINASTGVYADSNFQVSIIPLTCSTYVAMMNEVAEKSLLEIGLNDLIQNNQSYVNYLLTDYINGSIEIYTGNYAIKIYNITEDIGLPEYNYSSHNRVNETVHTDLPILSIELKNKYILMGSDNNLTLNISLAGTDSLQISLSEEIYFGNNKYLPVVNRNENITNLLTNPVSTGAFVPYINAKLLTLIVQIHTDVPTYQGENLTHSFVTPLVLNVMLNTSHSYTWLRDQNILKITVNYSLLTGPFNFSIFAEASINSLSGELNTTTIDNVKASNENGSLDMLFNLTSLAENVTILITVRNGSLMLENASNVMHFDILENSSYFPLSNVDIKVEGLNNGMSWTIAFGNYTVTETGNNAEIQLPNGIYNYSFLPIPGYVSNQSAGIIAAIHDVEYLNVSFSRYEYTIMIQEVGLPSFTTWTILIGNNTIYTNRSTLDLYLPNGTYDLSFQSSDYVSENNSYPVLVTGSGVVLHIAFERKVHASMLDSVLKLIYGSPFSYLLATIVGIAYYRFYLGSARICSLCLARIPRNRLKCQHCKVMKKEG
jgi:hypothetical protein